MGGGDASIAARGEHAIEDEAGAHRDLAAHERVIQRQREGRRAHGMRCDAGGRPPFAHRLARALHIERLQIAQAAVNGAEVIERRAAPEILAFDQRDREAALRRVVGNREAIDAPAHDEHVEGAAGQAIEVTVHLWILRLAAFGYQLSVFS